MKLFRRVLLSVLLCGVLAMCTSVVCAKSGQVDELGERLTSGADFRIRTQAALALGASGERDALRPLCKGLADTNRTVRAAVAAALGRLALGGKRCISKRLKNEKDSSVRSALRSALAKVSKPRTTITDATRVYVAIGEVSNSSARPDSFVSERVTGALRKHLSELPDVSVAPAAEKPRAARRLLASHDRAKGVYLLPRVSITGAGGGLTLRLELSLFTYPERALVGTINKKLTMPDTPLSDTASLLQLIDVAAEQLSQTIRKTAARI